GVRRVRLDEVFRPRAPEIASGENAVGRRVVKRENPIGELGPGVVEDGTRDALPLRNPEHAVSGPPGLPPHARGGITGKRRARSPVVAVDAGGSEIARDGAAGDAVVDDGDSLIDT